VISLQYVPSASGRGITVHLPKASCKGSPKNVDDYRGITILPTISKLVERTIEKCLLPYLYTSTSQFGFKKGHSCAQAVFSARKIIDLFSHHGSTVNICSLDISKAFDRVNHVKLFNKLADHNVPVKLIYILMYWFAIMETCVRWGNTLSYTLFICQWGSCKDRYSRLHCSLFMLTEC